MDLFGGLIATRVSTADLRADHRQEHFESTESFDRMRLICRQEYRITCRRAQRPARYRYFGFALQEMGNSVEGCSVFTQTLTFIERE